MKLFTAAINEKLFAQYHKGSDLSSQKVVAKIFNPYGRGTWYIINSDPDDPDYLWAIVKLFDVEVGSVSRSELENMKVPPYRLSLERDTSFTPMNAQEVYNGLLSGKHYAKGGTTSFKPDVEVLENKDGSNYLFPESKTPDSFGITFGHGGQTNHSESENQGMLKNQVVNILHHANELNTMVDKSMNVEPWVITKAQRSATDLADITHYLEGESKKMAQGGTVSDIYALVGKKYNIIPLGNETSNLYTEIVNVRVSPPSYDEKVVTITSANGDVERIPLAKIDDFINGEEITLKDEQGEPYIIVLMNETMESGGVVGGLTADESIYLYVKKALVQKYREKYLRPAGLWNTTKGKEVELSLIKKGYLNSAGSINETGKNKIKEVDAQTDSIISKEYITGFNLPSIYKQVVEKFEGSPKMAMGGTTFEDKVSAVKSSLLKRKKVSPKVQKDYGKTYSPAEAEESAKRIVGKMTARERMKMKLASKKSKK